MKFLVASSLLIFPLSLAAQSPKDSDISFPMEIEESSSLFQDLFVDGVWRADVEVDGLTSDDVNVYRSSASFEVDSANWTLGGSFGHTTHSIDYDPNLTTNPTHRSEEAFDGSLSLTRKWSETYSSSISGRVYDGFTDFRSLWISEFFFQSFGNFPEYEEADPRGYSVSIGNTWILNNGLDRLSVDLGFSRDRIAPGWEIGGQFFNEAERTDDVLDTLSGSIAFESTINGSLKTQQTIRLSEVTRRQLRVQYQTNWAWKINSAFTLRAELGGAYERPTFEAYFGGLTAIYHVNPNLQVSLGGRLYSDTGEITSANFNSAAPGLDSDEISLSALWTQGSHSVRASVGFYNTEFDESGVENLSFANLYSDRDFITFRVAYTHQF